MKVILLNVSLLVVCLGCRQTVKDAREKVASTGLATSAVPASPDGIEAIEPSPISLVNPTSAVLRAAIVANEDSPDVSLWSVSTPIDWGALGRLRRPFKLAIYQDTVIDDVSELGALGNLRELVLHHCQRLKDLGGLFAADKLASLSIMFCTNVRSECFLKLGSLHSLKKLSICRCDDLRDLKVLSNLCQIEDLGIGECPELQDISGLAKFQRLRRLELEYLSGILDFSPCGSLSSLEHLTIMGCEVTDIAFIRNMSHLRSIRLGDCKRLLRLDGIEHLGNVEIIELDNLPSLYEFGPILVLPKLRELHIRGTRMGTKELEKISNGGTKVFFRG